ncbi:MAG TPA: hypothetical protein ENI23_14205 [bacterium]|nr:hypothetical protein [bacterium]
MEQIMISGPEWSSDEQCIVHQAGNQFQIVLKKRVIDSLKLGERDLIKIYVKKVGHLDKEKRKITSGFIKKDENTEREQSEPVI